MLVMWYSSPVSRHIVLMLTNVIFVTFFVLHRMKCK